MGPPALPSELVALQKVMRRSEEVVGRFKSPLRRNSKALPLATGLVPDLVTTLTMAPAPRPYLRAIAVGLGR